MLRFFRFLALRVKAILAASAALDLEADFVSRSAERKAELLRLAQQYEQDGLAGVASELRVQAEALSLDRPFGPVAVQGDTATELAAEPREPRRMPESDAAGASAALAVEGSVGGRKRRRRTLKDAVKNGIPQ